MTFDQQRSVAGRVALVTGAASGIGRATASLLASEGVSVALFDRDPAAVHAAAETIVASGCTARGWAVDVTDDHGVAAAISEVSSTLGAVDILVNCAGMSVLCPIEDDRYVKAWDLALAVHLTGSMRMIRGCLDDLARNGEGRVVNVASVEGFGATAGLSPYTVAKHGVIGLTRSYAVELAPRGVLVNAVSPGPIHTGITAGVADRHKERFAQRYVPVARYGEPEEVAHVILTLCLPGTSYVTGAVVPVDGGMLVQLQPSALGPA